MTGVVSVDVTTAVVAVEDVTTTTELLFDDVPSCLLAIANKLLAASACCSRIAAPSLYTPVFSGTTSWSDAGSSPPRNSWNFFRSSGVGLRGILAVAEAMQPSRESTRKVRKKWRAESILRGSSGRLGVLVVGR